MSQIVASIVLCASYVLIILTIVITCAGICSWWNTCKISRCLLKFGASSQADPTLLHIVMWVYNMYLSCLTDSCEQLVNAIHCKSLLSEHFNTLLAFLYAEKPDKPPPEISLIHYANGPLIMCSNNS